MITTLDSKRNVRSASGSWPSRGLNSRNDSGASVDECDNIGWSEEGRPLRVQFFGQTTSPLRILILAGQHGDEAYARKSAKLLCDMLRETPALDQPRIAILANANPDGAVRQSRTNATGTDLNRDHQALSSSETEALHRFVRVWRPHLVIDVHTYPPRRKHLLAQGLVHCHDVFLDVPTNPSLPGGLAARLQRSMLPEIVDQLEQDGYRSGRYPLTNAKGRARHSTPDVVDTRNGIALRYAIPTILVEGREPTQSDPPRVYRDPTSSVAATLGHVIDWARANEGELRADLPLPGPGTEIPIACRYKTALHPLRMRFWDERAGQIRRVRFPGRYTDSVSITGRVRLPRAYAIPASATHVLDNLRRHGFTMQPAEDHAHYRVERYDITHVHPSRRPDRAARRVTGTRSTQSRGLSDYILVPVADGNGTSLAVLLEPTSKYGLHRWPSLGLTLRPGAEYPVLRVV